MQTTQEKHDSTLSTVDESAASPSHNVECPLRQFTTGERNYGIIVGRSGYIVTDNDFCHITLGLNEPAEVNTKTWETVYQSLTLDEINALAQPIESFRKWAHYWGIKDRIAVNYHGLLRSMKEIGVDTVGMPKWKEDII